MTPPRSAISVLRFGAGELAMAVAAEDVTRVELARAGVPHIGALLGLDASVPPGVRSTVENGVEGGAEEGAEAAARGRMPKQRMVHVKTRGARGEGAVAFLADPPVEVIPCHASDIVPVAPGISRAGWQPVMGFARIDGQMILLLDIPGIVQALAEHQEREER